MGTITPHLLERLLSITGTPEDRDALVLAIQTGGGDITGDEVAYDNSASGLAATTVQEAIDEVAQSGGGGGSTVISATLIQSSYSPVSIAGAVIDPLTHDGFDLDYIIKRKYTNADITRGEVDVVYTSNTTLTQLNSDVTGLSFIGDDLVVAGLFTDVGGTTVGRIAKFDSEGNNDATFTGPGTGANNSITLLKQNTSDNSMWIAGTFTSYNGTTAARFAHLNTDGSIDTTFATNISTGFNSEPKGVAHLVSDSKIAIAGNFTTFKGVTRNRIVMLNMDGTEDTTFATNIGTGANNQILSVAAMGSKIIIVGNFTSFNGNAINRIAVLNVDGTLDMTFRTNVGTGLSSTVTSVDYDAVNDKILVAGFFISVNGVSRPGMARLSSAGIPDTAFNVNIQGPTISLSATVICSNGATYYTSGSNSILLYIDSTGKTNTMFSLVLSGDIYQNAYCVGNSKIAVGGNISSVNEITSNRFTVFTKSQTGQDLNIYEKGTGAGYFDDESSVFIYQRTGYVGQDSYIPLTVDSTGQLQYTAGNVIGNEIENSIKLTIRSL